MVWTDQDLSDPKSFLLQTSLLIHIWAMYHTTSTKSIKFSPPLLVDCFGQEATTEGIKLLGKIAWDSVHHFIIMIVLWKGEQDGWSLIEAPLLVSCVREGIHCLSTYMVAVNCYWIVRILCEVRFQVYVWRRTLPGWSLIPPPSILKKFTGAEF